MRILLLTTVALVLPFSASADLIISYDSAPAGAVTTTFDGGSGGCSSNPMTAIDAGFSITSDGPACFPASTQLDFLENGSWINLPYIEDGSGSTTLTINLGGYYSYAGGFINYGLNSPDFNTYGPEGNDPTITALDANMNVIESFDIFRILNGEDSDENAGAYFGISESADDISYLQISGGGIAMTNLALVSPESGTWALAALALIGMGFVALRKRRLSI